MSKQFILGIVAVLSIISIIIFVKDQSREIFLNNKALPITAKDVGIYLINLKERQDRLENFQQQYQKTDLANIEYRVVNAVNGRDIEIRNHVTERAYAWILEAERTGYRKKHYELTRGGVGCYLSHMETLKRIAKGSAPYGLVLEDDVLLKKKNILASLNTELQTIPDDWDMLLLGCVCFVCGRFERYYDINRFFLMHAYIVKKSSAAKILQLISGEKIEQQIDSNLSDLAQQGMLKIYCLRNKLAVQNQMGTNIQMPVMSIDGINPYDPLH